MATYKVLPDREHALPNLTNTLLITWVCSILWGGGIFFSIVAFLGAVVAGLLGFFGPPAWNTSGTIMLTSGLISALSSPILLGAMISHSWRSGIRVGLFASVVTIITLFVTWIGNDAFYNWVHSWSGYFSYLHLLKPALGFGSVLIVSLTAFTTIKSLTLTTKLHQYSLSELVLSAIVSIGLSAVSGIVLRIDLLTNNNIFHFIWQIPLLVWISTVYLPELLAGRSRTIDFLVWAFLTLISFGLPFIVMPLFPLK